MGEKLGDNFYSAILANAIGSMLQGRNRMKCDSVAFCEMINGSMSSGGDAFTDRELNDIAGYIGMNS